MSHHENLGAFRETCRYAYQSGLETWVQVFLGLVDEKHATSRGQAADKIHVGVALQSEIRSLSRAEIDRGKFFPRDQAAPS